jgi:hypothetical protein
LALVNFSFLGGDRAGNEVREYHRDEPGGEGQDDHNEADDRDVDIEILGDPGAEAGDFFVFLFANEKLVANPAAARATGLAGDTDAGRAR